MEKVKQRLIISWANYWSRHVLQTTAELLLGAIILGGTTTAAIIIVPTELKAQKDTPIKHVIAQKPSTPPTPKKTQPAKPTVATQAPAPIPQTPPAQTSVAVTPPPKPQPINSTQPSPGKSIQKLVPSTTSSSTPSSGTTSTGGSSTTNTSNTSGSTTSTSSSTTNTQPALATGGYESSNWSGYAALSGKFTSISGSWTIPSVTGNSSSTSGDAAWVGIGGVSNTDLIQTGTMDMVATDGTVDYAAFYELLPSPAMEITSFTIQPGDTIDASISQLSSSSWSISIKDETSGQTYATTVSYTSSYSSADWIEEDPSNANGTLVPLDNFSHVIFSNASTTMNGTVTDLSTSSAAPITLIDSSNNPVLSPTILTNNNTGFWVVHD